VPLYCHTETADDVVEIIFIDHHGADDHPVVRPGPRRLLRAPAVDGSELAGWSRGSVDRGSPVLLRNATPSVFHQRHIGRVLRSS
jgi:hypothetical protein